MNKPIVHLVFIFKNKQCNQNKDLTSSQYLTPSATNCPISRRFASRFNKVRCSRVCSLPMECHGHVTVCAELSHVCGWRLPHFSSTSLTWSTHLLRRSSNFDDRGERSVFARVSLDRSFCSVRDRCCHVNSYHRVVHVCNLDSDTLHEALWV